MKSREATDDSRVIGVPAVTMEFIEVFEEPLNEV
jgi:hypothetical protein